MTARGRAGVLAVVLALLGALGLGSWLLLRPSAPSVAPQPSPGPTPTPTVTSTPPVVLAPLTGLPVSDPTVLDRPAVAIKVSDVRSAHPQVGVDRADIVVVEPIGVAYTRLAAVFHSDLPDQVGPVRSVRPMDAALLSPLNPVFGHTMAAEWVLDYVLSVGTLDSLGSLQVPADSGAYLVDPDRPRPDHVLAQPPVLVELATTARVPPPAYVVHAASPAEASTAGGSPAASLTVPYGPGWSVRWTYDPASGRYLREQPWGPHETVAGVQVSATTVLVLEVDSVLERDLPVLQLIDRSGALWALSGGSVVRGTWSKGAVDEPFVLRTQTDQPLLLAPGTTWVELPAPDAGVTTG